MLTKTKFNKQIMPDSQIFHMKHANSPPSFLLYFMSQRNKPQTIIEIDDSASDSDGTLWSPPKPQPLSQSHSQPQSQPQAPWSQHQQSDYQNMLSDLIRGQQQSIEEISSAEYNSVVDEETTPNFPNLSQTTPNYQRSLETFENSKIMNKVSQVSDADSVVSFRQGQKRELLGREKMDVQEIQLGNCEKLDPIHQNPPTKEQSLFRIQIKLTVGTSKNTQIQGTRSFSKKT